jgi:hypothetical protein
MPWSFQWLAPILKLLRVPQSLVILLAYKRHSYHSRHSKILRNACQKVKRKTKYTFHHITHCYYKLGNAGALVLGWREWSFLLSLKVKFSFAYRDPEIGPFPVLSWLPLYLTFPNIRRMLLLNTCAFSKYRSLSALHFFYYVIGEFGNFARFGK